MRYEQLSVGVLNVDDIQGPGAQTEMGIGEKWYIDPVNGSNGNSGKRAGTALETLAAAFSATTAAQNDTIFALPGVAATQYTTTATLAWNKDNTHLVGLAGPGSLGGDYYTSAGVCFWTSTASQADVLNITGDCCQFYNFQVQNRGDNAANIAGVLLNGRGCYFKNVSIQGVMMGNQRDTAACASLIIGAGGDYPLFENCIIGNNLWGTRTGASSGQLFFNSGATSGPQNGEFRNCKFLSQSETAAVGLVLMSGAACVDRVWTYDRCLFHNFSVNWTVPALTSVFVNTLVQTNYVILKDCMCVGFTEWQTGNYGIMFTTNSPIADAQGGIAVEATGD